MDTRNVKKQEILLILLFEELLLCLRLLSEFSDKLSFTGIYNQGIFPSEVRQAIGSAAFSKFC